VNKAGGVMPIPEYAPPKLVEEQQKQKNAIDRATYAMHVISKAEKHPGLKTAVGLSGKIDPRNYMAGTDATDFQILLDQMQGQTFLQAFESLKGAGQITEVEGTKATNAIARLNRAQSEKEFRTSLAELKSILEKASKKIPSQDAFIRPKPTPAKPAAPTSNVRKYNPVTGRIE
jgi:hypothetical protein